MKMLLRKLVFTVILSIFSVQLFAQSAAQMAEQAFNISNYEDAAQLYDMAASLASGSEKTALYDAAKKSRTCK